VPYAIEFPVGASDRPPPPSNLYRALYANLLEWIGAANPDLVEGLQERPARKPFTISAPVSYTHLTLPTILRV